MSPKLHALISRYELHVGLGPVHAAKLLAIPYSTYNQYRNQRRTLPADVERHVRLVIALPSAMLDRHIGICVHGLVEEEDTL